MQQLILSYRENGHLGAGGRGSFFAHLKNFTNCVDPCIRDASGSEAILKIFV